MKASPFAYDIIKEFEALRLHAYQDQGGIWTIGWGTTRYPSGERVQGGDTCDEDQAMYWLIWHVQNRCEQPLNAALKVAINQKMYDALISLIYNCGTTITHSTLMNSLNSGKYLEAAEEFDRWNKVSGRVVNGLVRRRDQEQALFNDGISEAVSFAEAQGWLTDSKGSVA